jgi:polyphosphate kinase
LRPASEGSPIKRTFPPEAPTATSSKERPGIDGGDKVSVLKTLVLDKREYLKELARLQVELVRLQEWIVHKGLKVVVLFEGRDTAGKDGVIRRISERTNPRVVRTVALGRPSDRERTQWYFQRYVAHLPSAGEMALFDRSWYNRAGVERVMGFCSDEEYAEFMRTCPKFEVDIQRSGIVLVKYWLSVSNEEQERRFEARLSDPAKRWKLSPVDMEARARWVDYAEAKDEMFAHTDTEESPWFVVDADDKRTARLNLISHLLAQIPYERIDHDAIQFPPRQERAYVRPPVDSQTFVPDRYRVQ